MATLFLLLASELASKNALHSASPPSVLCTFFLLRINTFLISIASAAAPLQPCQPNQPAHAPEHTRRGSRTPRALATRPSLEFAGEQRGPPDCSVSRYLPSTWRALRAIAGTEYCAVLIPLSPTTTTTTTSATRSLRYVPQASRHDDAGSPLHCYIQSTRTTRRSILRVPTASPDRTLPGRPAQHSPPAERDTQHGGPATGGGGDPFRLGNRRVSRQSSRAPRLAKRESVCVQHHSARGTAQQQPAPLLRTVVPTTTTTTNHHHHSCHCYHTLASLTHFRLCRPMFSPCPPRLSPPRMPRPLWW